MARRKLGKCFTATLIIQYDVTGALAKELKGETRKIYVELISNERIMPEIHAVYNHYMITCYSPTRQTLVILYH